MHIKKIITALLVSVFCAGIIHANQVPESIITADAIAPFGTAGTEYHKAQCTFAPNPGSFKVEIQNRYNRKINGEDWQCVELKVTFTSEPTEVYSRDKPSVRVFRLEHAYIQRGNRWERRRLGNIDHCFDEWKYSKLSPTDKMPSRIWAGSPDNKQFAKVTSEIDEYCTKHGYNVNIILGKKMFMHVGTEMTTPALTDSPSYPYSADVVLKIDKKDGKPYDKDVRLKLRFSAKDESWELAAKEP